MILEDYADHLYYYPEGNESRPIDHNLESDGNIVFYTNDNETERHILWKFTSDGSWQSHGFNLIFESVLCSCSSPIMSVSCFGENLYHLMPTDNNFYCGNLECNFIIKLDSFCTASHIKIILDTSSNQDDADNTDEEIFDIFKFISNDYIQLEINHTNRYLGSWTFYMPAKMNNSISVITMPSFYPRMFELRFNTINVPENIPTIELTESNPYYSYYLCPKIIPAFFLIKLSADLVNPFIREMT
uniref:CUB domain-containing protein n=1 Tax=Panagrolaimus davidi TaxID=227884 RepID=A0A914PH53_9BILA